MLAYNKEKHQAPPAPHCAVSMPLSCCTAHTQNHVPWHTCTQHARRVLVGGPGESNETCAGASFWKRGMKSLCYAPPCWIPKVTQDPTQEQP